MRFLAYCMTLITLMGGYVEGMIAKGSTIDDMFRDQINFWLAFRDDETGLFCDSLYFDDNQGCGESNNRYSSASTGMGLIMDAVLVELNLMNTTDAENRAEQTFQSLFDMWPQESFHGFFVHWTDRTGQIQGEFSTIDSALLALGGLFSANYFNDNANIQSMAMKLAESVQWSDALEAYNSPIIYPVANETSGEMTGVIRPYNEYYLVSYLAAMFNGEVDDNKATRFFETYFGTTEKPAGDGTYPYDVSYYEYSLLTDNNITYMSSFIPQFCWYQAKGYHTNDYYFKELYPNWLSADKLYWSNVIQNASLTPNPFNELWGLDISDRSFFGCGAGDSPTGYSVVRIDDTSLDFVFSAAIMAGFLPAALQSDNMLKQQQQDAVSSVHESIVEDLTWLYDNVAYETGLGYKVVWRYSLAQSDWHASLADSIDYVTMVLGLSTLYLDLDFFETYAA
jgi:hypothetical protein